MRDGPVNCNRAIFMRNRRNSARDPQSALEFIPEVCTRCGAQSGNIGAVKSRCLFMDKAADLSAPEPFVYKPAFVEEQGAPPSVGNYAAHPPSVTELRANREGDGTKWTARDVLVSSLRRIDTGEINPDTLVLFYRNPDAKAKNGFGYSYTWAGVDEDVAAGVIQRCAIMFNEGD